VPGKNKFDEKSRFSEGKTLLNPILGHYLIGKNGVLHSHTEK
jgi:hypothetical protein